MKNSLPEKGLTNSLTEKYLRNLRQKHRRVLLVAIMAAIVTVCTAYALISPASTQEICDLPEHSHTAKCWAQAPDETQASLICGLTEHSHNAECMAVATEEEREEEPKTESKDDSQGTSDDKSEDDSEDDSENKLENTGDLAPTDSTDEIHQGNDDNNADDNDNNNNDDNEQTAPPDYSAEDIVEHTLVSAVPATFANVADTALSVSNTKPDKDNSDNLTVIESADTDGLITVNLYDYDSNINGMYNTNPEYPAFQQDGGTDTIGSAFSNGSFNFGNIITSDLAAGKDNVTNNGGSINATANSANSPIEGAMKSTLQGGYPALNDGTSLDYLFSNNMYAKKMNTNSINGLFIYNETTGAYSFNSRETHAQYNRDNNTFTLYAQLLSPNFMMYPFGNFLPFNDIVHQSAPASAIDKAYLQQIAASAEARSSEGDEYSKLAANLTAFINLMDSNYTEGWSAADCANEYFSAAGVPNAVSPRKFTDDDLSNIYCIDFDEATDFYFGMDMSLEFMQPKDGRTGKDGNQDMIFYFTGDDDVWVYVDDVLFLDLSGIHRHVGGEIDFAAGTVKYYSLDVNTGDVATTPYKTVYFKDLVNEEQLSGGTFKNYTHHTFNFYYMERGAGSGVCRMNFNFPLLRQNSISVSKELSGDGASQLNNRDFRFRILQEDGEALFIESGAEYDLTDSDGNKLSVGNTDEFGVFSIKAGQTATFSGIDENSGKYFVQELLPTDEFTQYDEVRINNNPVTSYQDVTVNNTSFKGANSPLQDMSDGSMAFSFNNHLDKDTPNTPEKTAQVNIPLQKHLNSPDGKPHTYLLRMEQVTDQSGATATPNGYCQNLNITVTNEPVEAAFTVDYTASKLGELPQTLYYKIYEPSDDKDSSTEYDTTCYIIEVTVQYNDDGRLTAEVSRRWQDGNLMSDSEAIRFDNVLIRYELPQTGGTGSTPFYVLGTLLFCSAGLLLLYRRRTAE